MVKHYSMIFPLPVPLDLEAVQEERECQLRGGLALLECGTRRLTSQAPSANHCNPGGAVPTLGSSQIRCEIAGSVQGTGRIHTRELPG